MRQVAHIFYAIVFLLLGSSGQPLNRDEHTPDFRDFHRRIRGGEISLIDNNRKIDYGWVHWNRFLENTRTPRHSEALRIVSDLKPS
jgi:hypothetical protein